MDHLLDNVHPSSELRDRVLHLQSWIIGRKTVGNRKEMRRGRREKEGRQEKRMESREKRVGRGNKEVGSEEHKATNTNGKTPDLPPVCITVD